MKNEFSLLTLDGEDERRVAIGVLRVDVDPRQLEQLARLLLSTFKEREGERKKVSDTPSPPDDDDEVVCLAPRARQTRGVFEHHTRFDFWWWWEL